MKGRIIGLSGKARVGKDTAAEFLAQHGFKRIAFADPLKNAASIMFGIPRSDFDDPEKKEKLNLDWALSPRQIAQRLGTEGGRNVFGHSFWVKRAALTIKQLVEAHGPSDFVITDCRFDEEAEWIRRRGGIVIEVRRKDAAPVAAHSSENGISEFLVDERIDNNGTLEEFEAAVLKKAGLS